MLKDYQYRELEKIYSWTIKKYFIYYFSSTVKRWMEARNHGSAYKINRVVIIKAVKWFICILCISKTVSFFVSCMKYNRDPFHFKMRWYAISIPILGSIILWTVMLLSGHYFFYIRMKMNNIIFSTKNSIDNENDVIFYDGVIFTEQTLFWSIKTFPTNIF